MIILDSNVISEVMSENGEPAVFRWLDRQNEEIWTTTISVFEVQFGIEKMPEGKKKLRLEYFFRMVLEDRFRKRIFSFDQKAALEASKLAGFKRKIGQNIDHRDSMIAGIAVVNRASIVTRNVKDFSGLPVAVINPWED